MSIRFSSNRPPAEKSPESKTRQVIDACADCDCCRPPMDPACGVFDTLFRLYDREKEGRGPIRPAEYRELVDLCNFCALCPCPDIRSGLIEAKTRFVSRDGAPLSSRLLADVERLGRLCGAAPRLAGATLRGRTSGRLLRRVMDIHRKRKLPAIPDRPFQVGSRAADPAEKTASKEGRKVAYFVGCTGRYFFPSVPRAAAAVLKRFGASVFLPFQQCCGMPFLLEGDRKGALERAERNLSRLSALVEEGFVIVCSCPTCSFMLRSVVSEGAWYSDAYQRSIGADPAQLKIPGREKSGFSLLSKTIYGSILKDAGLFSRIDPLHRANVARNTYDLGEYLQTAACADGFPAPGPVSVSGVYFPPCHQREQQIGRPWQQLLSQVPGLSLETIDNHFYCCGMGGVMGLKNGFYNASLRQGRPLFSAIEAMAPERVVTDCLSCRLQFEHALRLPVLHPVEILSEALAGLVSR